MEVLHRFEHLRLAQAFSDYLTSLEIGNIIEKNEFYHQIVITDTNKFIQAQLELTHFLANPTHKKYLSASWQSGKIEQNPAQFSYANMGLLSNIKKHGGLLTHSILIVCLSVYILLSLGLFHSFINELFFFSHQPFNYSQSWRFITPAFLHFSVLHIAFNLLWWWQLGGVIELKQGKQRLLLLFLFAAITSNIAQFFFVGPNFGGLSGVVYALIGYCWLYGNLNKNSDVRLPNNLFMFLLGWLVLGFVDLLPVNIANYAHLVGLLTGLFFAMLYSKLKL